MNQACSNIPGVIREAMALGGDEVMATSAFHLQCTFAGTHGNNFNFQVGVDETDIQSDTFHESTSSVYWLRNKDNLFLYVARGDQLVFEDLPNKAQGSPGCKFTVQTFNEDPDNPPHPENRGRPVTLSAVVGNEYKVVSCGKTYEINVETMDSLPERIDNDHCTLFFMKAIGDSRSYVFQSAVHNTHVLGFEQVPGDVSMRKLVLRHRLDDMVDEGCHIDVAPC